MIEIAHVGGGCVVGLARLVLHHQHLAGNIIGVYLLIDRNRIVHAGIALLVGRVGVAVPVGGCLKPGNHVLADGADGVVGGIAAPSVRLLAVVGVSGVVSFVLDLL